MNAIQILPDHYHVQKKLDLSGSRTVLWLNLAAIPLLVLFGWLFSRLINAFRTTAPFVQGFWGLIASFSGWGLIGILALIILMLVVHELIHGMFFWLFTRERPKFALRSGYAFAAAPNWYLPKFQYIIVGISPLIVISIVCVVLAIFVPATMVPYPLFVATFNAAGALGDMIVVAWILGQSNTILVKDQGDKFFSFAPESE
jgi:Putative zincin peptidase